MSSLESKLRGSGWTAFALDSLSDESDDELASWLVAFGYDADDLPELRRLIIGSGAAAARDRRTFANASDSSLYFEHCLKGAAVEAAASSSRALVAAKVVPVGTALYVHWPSRIKRSLGKVAGDAALRQKLEVQERSKWSARLSAILVAAALPATRDSTGRMCELSELKRTCKGRRASTLKSHVRYCEGFIAWLSLATGLLWPSSAMDLVRYLETRAEEPCGRTVPGTIQRSLVFVEAAGEVALGERIATHPAVLNLLEELSTSLGSAVRSKRRACQVPVSMAIHWENTVCDVAVEIFVRGYAWFKLVKLWTGMRWSDTTGMPPANLRLDSRGLLGQLDRTKTSGAGKKVEQLFVYVSFEAFVVQRDWLEIGFVLWKKMGLESGSSERDFFLTRPNRALDGCVLAMARYCDAAAMTLALSRRWTYIDSLGETQPTLLQNIASCWTEHSERSTITTWARCCGILPEVIKRLCRWQQSCAEDYVRASRLLVEGAQEVIAASIRAGKGEADFLDEENLWDQISWKYGREIGEAFLEDQISRLRYFGPSAGRTNRGDETPRVVDSPIVEELGNAKEVERPNQTFQLADTQLDPEPDLGEVLASSSEDESRPLPPTILQRYFISVTGSAQKRRLHLGGACWRLPGKDYADFIECGEDLPESSAFHAVCKQCFPLGVQSDVLDEELSSSGSSKTSEEDSA